MTSSLITTNSQDSGAPLPRSTGNSDKLGYSALDGATAFGDLKKVKANTRHQQLFSLTDTDLGRGQLFPRGYIEQQSDTVY